MKLISVCCIFSWLFFSACGNNNNRSAFKSSLDENKQLKDLSSSDMAAICNETTSYLYQNISKDKLCASLGVAMGSMSGSQQLCQQTVDECIKSPQNPGAGDCKWDLAKLVDCTATIQNLNDCINEMLPATSRILSQMSCADLNLTILKELQGIPSTPACDNIKSQCPNVAK